MKKIALFAVAAVATIFTACDDNDLLDIELNGELEKSINVATTAVGDTSYTNVFTLSLDDNEEFAKHKDKIKSVVINKITVEVTNVNIGTDSTAIDLDLGAFNDGNSAVLEIQPISIRQARENSTVYELELNQGFSDFVNDYLLTTGELKFNIGGNLINAPVDVDLKFTFDATITANPAN